MTAPTTRTLHVSEFELEDGTVLRDFVQAYTLDGELNAAGDNLIVVFHSLTGDTSPREWWPGVVGPNAPIDPSRHAILCANLLGSCYGTTLPRRSEDDLPPSITTRDMARLVKLLVDEVGASSVALATGGSLGGMVALEWAATFPELTRAVVAFAAPAAHTAQAIAWNHVQRRAIELAGPEGLALSRMIAMISYRTAAEFNERFGRSMREDGYFQMRSYLDHHGQKLVERFDTESYLSLIDTMDAHDVGRGRGGVAAALRAFRGRLVGVGITGDLLYSLDDVRAWVDAADGELRTIDSPHGHDAFLLEVDQVAEILKAILEETELMTAAQAAEMNFDGGME